MRDGANSRLSQDSDAYERQSVNTERLNTKLAKMVDNANYESAIREAAIVRKRRRDLESPTNNAIDRTRSSQTEILTIFCLSRV